MTDNLLESEHALMQ